MRQAANEGGFVGWLVGWVLEDRYVEIDQRRIMLEIGIVFVLPCTVHSKIK